MSDHNKPKFDAVGAITVDHKETGTSYTGTYLLIDGVVRVSVQIHGHFYGQATQLGAMTVETLAQTLLDELVRQHVHDRGPR
jgi:hypothetical protein